MMVQWLVKYVRYSCTSASVGRGDVWAAAVRAADELLSTGGASCAGSPRPDAAAAVRRRTGTTGAMREASDTSLARVQMPSSSPHGSAIWRRRARSAERSRAGAGQRREGDSVWGRGAVGPRRAAGVRVLASTTVVMEAAEQRTCVRGPPPSRE
jgi:hypothetical protein